MSSASAFATSMLLPLLLPRTHAAVAWCESHDASDSNEALCEEWCSHENHCAFCKCQKCSLCQTPCHSDVAGDVSLERCEEWCSDSSHCGMCKCKGCELCKGHHPERSCAPSNPADLDFESCESWCEAIPQHCNQCKCKGCAKCAPAPPVPCTSNYANDVRVAQCESWCTGAYHCPQAHAGTCKCGLCSFCPRCDPWCARAVDCNAKACASCPLKEMKSTEK